MISTSEWRAALAASDVPVEGFTVRELAASLGRTEGWVQRKLRELHAAGRVVHVGWRTVSRLDGQAAKVPVYRLRGKKPSPK